MAKYFQAIEQTETALQFYAKAEELSLSSNDFYKFKSAQMVEQLKSAANLSKQGEGMDGPKEGDADVEMK